MADAAPTAADISGLITAAADKYGVDPGFALNVAHAESGLNPKAVSPRGAVGVMQLEPKTADDLGVDPHDTAQNIDGGVRYLAQLGHRFGGSPELVAAAYNSGPHAVEKHGGVPPYKETQAYVRKVTGAPASNADAGPSLGALYKSMGWSASGKPPAAAAPEAPSAPDDSSDAGPSLDAIYKGAGFDPKKAAPAAPAPAAGPPVSPSMAAALKDAQAREAAAKGGDGAMAVLNPFGINLLPAASGVVNAGLTAGQGALASVGIGKAPAYSPGEAYEAERQTLQGAIDNFNAKHRGVNLAANVASMATGGGEARLAHATEGALTRLAPRLAENVGGRVATRLAGGAAASAAAGSGDALSHGEDAAGVAEAGGESALLSLPFGLAGEGVAGALHGVPGNTGRVVRVAGGMASGAAVGAGMSAATGGNPGQGAEEGAVYGGLGGLGGGKGGRDGAEPTAADRAAALKIAAKGLPSPEVLEAAPHGTLAAELAPQGSKGLVAQSTKEGGTAGRSIGDALEQRSGKMHDRLSGAIQEATGLDPTMAEVHGQHLIESAAASPESTTALAVAHAQHNSPAEVRSRVGGLLQTETGIDPGLAEVNGQRMVDSAAASPQSGAALSAAHAQRYAPEAVSGRLSDAVQDVSGIHPETARSDVATQTQAARAALGPEYDTVLGRGENAPKPVWNDELRGLAKEDMVKAALASAARGMPKGTAYVDNPALQSGAPVPQERMSAAELRSQMASSGAVASGVEPTASDIMGFLKGRTVNVENPNPRQVPSAELWHAAKRVLEEGTDRDAFGKPANTVRNGQQAQWGRKLGSAMGDAIPGYREVTAKAGDYLGNDRAAKQGAALWGGGKNAEDPVAFAKRFAKMTPAQQHFTRSGWVGELYNRVARNRSAPETALASTRDQQIARVLFGDVGGKRLAGAFQDEAKARKSTPAQGLDKRLADAVAFGRNTVGSGRSGPAGETVRKQLEAMSPVERHAARVGHVAQVNRLLESGAGGDALVKSPAQREIFAAFHGQKAADAVFSGLEREAASKGQAAPKGLDAKLASAAAVGRAAVGTGRTGPTVEAIRKQIGAMTPQERQALRLAHVGQINRLLENGKGVEELLNSPAQRQIFAMIHGPAAADKFFRALERERGFAHGARQLQGAVRSKGVAQDSEEPILLGGLLGGEAHHFNPVAMAHGALAGYAAKTVRGAVMGALHGRYSPGVRNALGEILAKPAKEAASDIRASKSRSTVSLGDMQRGPIERGALRGVQAAGGFAAARALNKALIPDPDQP